MAAPRNDRERELMQRIEELEKELRQYTHPEEFFTEEENAALEQMDEQFAKKIDLQRMLDLLLARVPLHECPTDKEVKCALSPENPNHREVCPKCWKGWLLKKVKEKPE